MENKYTEIAGNYHSFPIAFKTFRSINQVGMDFISALAIAFHQSLMTHERHFSLSNDFLL